MKFKTLLLSALAVLALFSACNMTPKDEAMKKAAMTITEDFINGNIDAFTAALDSSVRVLYPADQVLAAYQAISMIMGAPERKAKEVTMSMMGENPVVTVSVAYQGGRIAYNTGFDTKGHIIAFAPAPVDGEIVYTEEDIIITPDSTTSASR